MNKKGEGGRQRNRRIRGVRDTAGLVQVCVRIRFRVLKQGRDPKNKTLNSAEAHSAGATSDQDVEAKAENS